MNSGSGAQAFRTGVLDALAFPAWTVGFALIGIGPLARDAGFSFTVAILSTVLIWAGPAQVVFFGMMASGAAPLAIAIGVSLSGVRLMPMAMSLMPLFGQRLRGLTLLLTVHAVAVTVWLQALRRLPVLPRDQRLGYYAGFAVACIGVSMVCTGGGYLAAAFVPIFVGAALMFMTPIFFTLTLINSAREHADWVAIGLGFGLVILFEHALGPSFALLATGLAGGSMAFLVHRLTTRGNKPDGPEALP
jgi:predicted branched-subunit amino acid permease